jgi:predicted NBD/HSP70 family sugar kinase
MRSQLLKATQQQTKTYNSQLVLKTIYERGPISRAEVARLTQLTRTTVSDLVTEFQEQGLVEEVGYGPSVGGRSPILLSVVADSRHLIGIDLANDQFCGAVVNLRNAILHMASVPIESRGGENALERVYELLDRLIAGADRPLLGIGIGTPGLVDIPNGVVLRAVNLEWRDLPLGRLLQDRYKLPVYIGNDSQLAALAQYMFGTQQHDGNLVVIKTGHGIGAGLVLNGHIFQGDGFGAGEIGHIAIVENGALCRCGNYGCLETVASTPAICRCAQDLACAHPDSLLNQPDRPSGEMTIDRIARAVRAGDATAQQIVRELGRYLGIAASQLVGTLNVRHIVLVGDLTLFGEPLAQAIRAEMRRRALPQLAQATQVELLDPSPDIVILGASALLLARELGLNLAR